MLKHSLFTTLTSLRGNPKACVLTEPLWGIPYQLYAPYVSVYMLNLGLKDSQIGLLVTIGMTMQIFWALMGGAITDKLGRRKTTFFFDFFAWSVPTLIWAVAQDFRYFVVAALFNAVWRVTQTSWNCLMVEDADPEQLVDIYSWVYISGLLSAFFVPIAGLLIGRFELVPTVRWLFIFSFIMMTIKFFILYFFSTETKQGEIRLKETRHQNMFTLVGEYGDVIRQLLRTPRTLYTLGILLSMNIATTIGTTFWAIIVTQRLEVPDSMIAIYPFARSIIMMVFFFLVMPAIKAMRFRSPMMVGFAALALSQLILITIPAQSYALLLLSTFLEACAYATVSTQIDRMLVVTIDAQERARITALLYLVVLIVGSPFGWIAGKLSEVNRTLPFMMNIGLYLIGFVLVLLASRHKSEEEGDSAPQVVEEALAS